jgi:hypothetical protein
MFSFKSKSLKKKQEQKYDTSEIKIQQDIITKKKQKQNKVMIKTYPKLVLNKLKVMEISTFIYTFWAPSSKKFFRKLQITTTKGVPLR